MIACNEGERVNEFNINCEILSNFNKKMYSTALNFLIVLKQNNSIYVLTYKILINDYNKHKH